MWQWANRKYPIFNFIKLSSVKYRQLYSKVELPRLKDEITSIFFIGNIHGCFFKILPYLLLITTFTLFLQSPLNVRERHLTLAFRLPFFISHMKESFPLCMCSECCTVIRYSRVRQQPWLHPLPAFLVFLFPFNLYLALTHIFAYRAFFLVRYYFYVT